MTFDPLIDEAPARYVVGIDLGTTNSAVTFVDTEQLPWSIEVLMIPQRISADETESLDTLPSFHFQPVESNSRLKKGADPNIAQHPRLKKGSDPNCRNGPAGASHNWGLTPFSNAFVGAFARDESTRTPGRGIASAKSWLSHSAVDRSAALLPWHGADDVQRLSPVEVSASFLNHIRESWDDQFPDYPLAEQDVVLTLPASFDEVARELTVEAAAEAGLPRVVLIEEPQAAFYAWVYKHDSTWESQVEIGQKILICDIGGGTTDFTLIRVRADSSETDSTARKIQFHRVAVGNHLILGGDNLDLAIAKHVEHKLTDGGKLEPHQWDVLVGRSRSVKEQLLSKVSPESVTINIPGRGSSLVGGSQQTVVTQQEVQELILAGFLPQVELKEKPQAHASGFQEFGLPYATDAAITRYLADFLVTHATAGLECQGEASNLLETARPDVVLFNGGFFASPLLRQNLVQQIADWFGGDSDWQPKILENDRLDLAVARGAAYYGMVRRDEGVRIAASLARSYYIGIASAASEKESDPNCVQHPEVRSGNWAPTPFSTQAICIVPGSAQPGETWTLSEHPFRLTLSQPVEFTLFVSSIRLADQPGQMLEIDPEQMTALPPIRTVLHGSSRNEKRDVAVELQIGLTEIGTLDLSCHEIDSDRSWKLQFDVRSTMQTDMEHHVGIGETEGVFDETLWSEVEQCLAEVFDDDANGDPKKLIHRMTETFGSDRDQWPMSLLRRIWSSLIERESGRRKSAQAEARWLNLLGYSLRPGYGFAMDDWRVTETWRTVQGKLIYPTAHIRNQSLILWRRLAGGLNAGQQSAIAQPLMASLRGLAKQMSGKKVKSSAVTIRPEESVEVWRLLGSLELLPNDRKRELGNMIVALQRKKKLAPAHDAMIWALGRLGQRTPMYGPLNTVVPTSTALPWVEDLIQNGRHESMERLAVVQMTRLTEDRYRDVDSETRTRVLQWLADQDASEHLQKLVREGGRFDHEEQGRVFGESLPQGLRLERNQL